MIRSTRKWLAGAVLAVTAYAALPMPAADAHGERTQEPSLRMRTIQFYDTRVSADAAKINDRITLTGRFRVFDFWPDTQPQPGIAYMNVLVPGARFVKEEVWVNGKFVPTSFQIEKGADYEYKMVIRARREGTYHVHPLVNLKGLGAVGGPGRFIDVSEGRSGFTNPTKLASSGKVVDLERYGLSYVIRWWAVWSVLGLGWLLYWISRRTLIRSAALVQANDEKALITPFHRKLGAGLVIVTLVVIAGSYKFTSDRFSPLVPLQAGSIRVDALDEPRTVEVAFVGGRYSGAKRRVVLELDVTNRGETPLNLGEFSTGTVRFVDENVKFVKESRLESSSGKDISLTGKIEPFSVEPGEKERLELSIVSRLWDTENLTSLKKTTESAFAGLLHFYDPEGERQVVAASGIVIPEFRS